MAKSRRRRVSGGRIYQYNPFSMSGYQLPPDAREKIQQILDNDLFWEYAEQLRVLEEKKQAINSYMDAIVKKIGGKRGKK